MHFSTANIALLSIATAALAIAKPIPNAHPGDAVLVPRYPYSSSSSGSSGSGSSSSGSSGSGSSSSGSSSSGSGSSSSGSGSGSSSSGGSSGSSSGGSSSGGSSSGSSSSGGSSSGGSSSGGSSSGGSSSGGSSSGGSSSGGSSSGGSSSGGSSSGGSSSGSTPPSGGGSTPSSGGAVPINSAAVSLIESLEGFDANFYVIDGDTTIGYGHDCTQRGGCDNLNPPISQAQGTALLQSDLTEYESCVCALSNASGLNSNQYGALVSFTYNSGCGGVQEYFSSYMDDSNFSGICSALPSTNTLNGELSSRRQKEGDFCSQATSDPSGC